MTERDGGSAARRARRPHARAPIPVLVAVVLIVPDPGAADPTRHGRDEHHVHVEAFPVAPAAPPPPILREHVPGLRKGMEDLSPFLRDTILNLHARSFYFNRQNTNDTANEAWALGGWLEYKSGWLLDTFAIGLTGYTSFPLYAPEDRDGTTLLRTGQEGFTALGEAYAKVRYKEYAVLTGGRQLIDQGYVNREDNRMIPNTFEALTLGGKLGPVRYDLGYLWTIKPRDENKFIEMSEQAGVENGDAGLLLTSLTVTPVNDLTVYLANYWVDDTFNTAYFNPEFTFRPVKDLGVSLGLQYTDQRNTGSDLLGTFTTWNVGARVQLAWRGLSLIGAMSATGEEASLRTPYGIWPGYLQMIETAFNRANEKAFGFGLRVDFSSDLLPFPVPGLSVLLF